MTKYEIAVRLLAEYVTCPVHGGGYEMEKVPEEWCAEHCSSKGDPEEEIAKCLEKVISDRYEARGEEDKTEPKTCDDAVSRKYLLKEYDRQHKGEPGGARRIIENAPSVTPKQKIGEWRINSDGYYPYCSECKEEPKNREMTKYCPNCGAKMEEQDANTHT